MGIKDGTQPPQPSKSPQILPFPVENQQPQLSITIDDADIGIFYREYYSMVYNRCLAMLRNKEDAQDAAHDVFAKIQELKSMGRLHVPYPKTYLSRAGTNMSINKKKRARQELNEIYDMATNGSLDWFISNGEQGKEVWEIGIADNGYDQVEAKMIVQAILDEQDETTRKIYFYKYHDDMTLEQIGEVVGLRKSAVQKRLKNLEEQARVKMRKVGK
jgi:RNA polymerase sigma-70 factor (ECF subfamily)